LFHESSRHALPWTTAIFEVFDGIFSCANATDESRTVHHDHQAVQCYDYIIMCIVYARMRQCGHPVLTVGARAAPAPTFATLAQSGAGQWSTGLCHVVSAAVILEDLSAFVNCKQDD
jgi:hypothetical protein